MPPHSEFQLKTSLLKDDNTVALLPGERMISSRGNVWSVAEDQGTVGTFVLTNIRLMWYSVVAATYTISLPYLQLQGKKIRKSKYGPTLVLQTTAW